MSRSFRLNWAHLGQSFPLSSNSSPQLSHFIPRIVAEGRRVERYVKMGEITGFIENFGQPMAEFRGFGRAGVISRASLIGIPGLD
jgi:hypothetical protein